MQSNGISSEDLEDGELEEEPGSAQVEPNRDSIENLHESEQKEHPINANITVDQQENPGMPNAIINGGEIPKTQFALHWTDFSLVKDETLKNLMMSWYYAGYYTGLYEGQQQAQRTSSK